jgi:hypothetical protein
MFCFAAVLALYPDLKSLMLNRPCRFDSGSGHHIEVSFVLLERRRVDLLETEKRDEAHLSGLYALPT